MALLLNEDEKMLQESAAGFFADKAPVSELRALRDSNDATGYSKPLWAEMAEMGFAGVLVPEAHGGVEMGYMAAGIIAEEMGRNLTASPFLSTTILAATALKTHGSSEQQAKYFSKITSGDTIFALAIDEDSKHNPDGIALQAEPSGNGFKLSGSKTMVVDGHVADHLIVAARTGEDLTLFLVPADTKGIETERTIMVDSRNAARIDFNDVEVTGEQVLGTVDASKDGLETVLNAGRAVLAAEMLGASSQVFDLTIDYLKERKQFGKIVGEFQALQHRAAHLYCELELARTAVLAALSALDEGRKDTSKIVSMAKAKLGQVAKLAALEAVQLHGGMGMTDEIDVGLYLKRIRVAQELFGDSDFHTQRIA